MKTTYFLELAFVNTLTNKLIGKDILINLNNKSFDEDNEPRLKGKSINYDGANTEINKVSLQHVKRKREMSSLGIIC